MSFRNLLGVTLATMVLGCAHTPAPQTSSESEASPQPRVNFVPESGSAQGNDRIPASEELFWFVHPCGSIKGAPFRKYHSFAFDTTTSELYGRSRVGADPNRITHRPRGRVAFDGVYDFFQEVGILQFCRQNGVDVGGPAGQEPQTPTTPPPPSTQVPDTPPNPGSSGRPPAFVAPVHSDTDRFYAELRRQLGSDTSGAQAKVMIQEFLRSARIQKEGAEDRIVSTCPATLAPGEVCVSQIDMGGSDDSAYRFARQKMMGELDLRQRPDGEYEVFDYYCQRWQSKEDFLEVTGDRNGLPGPDQIVHVRLMNCEHTWPQSKFVANERTREHTRQKTDWHHIFSTDTKANADRSNFEFAEVDPSTARFSICAKDPNAGRADQNGDVETGGMVGEPIPVLGTTAQGNRYFEPPKGFKGRLARALFYFSARYNAGMSTLQEHYLRQWHEQYPVTDEERERNEKAYRLSGVRNPFIDNPELVEVVHRFCRIRGGLNDGAGRSNLVPEYCEPEAAQ